MAMSKEKQPSVLKLRNWCQFCTGGLLTTGGLGWCLRLAYEEEPKAAMASYLAGSAGVCLMNMAIFKRPGTKDSEIPIRNWLMMITGGILVSSGFGYCLTSLLREHPKSTIIAYTAASVGYIMSNTVLYTMCGINEKRRKSPKLSNEKIAEIVDSANARLHYMGSTNQCAFCKAHVEKIIRERKEAEGRPKALNIKVRVTGFLRNLRNVFLHMGRAKYQDSPAAEKISSRGGLKREIPKTCQDKNIEKEQSDPREIEDENSSRKQSTENDGKEPNSGRSVESVIISAPDRKTAAFNRSVGFSRGPAPRCVYDVMEYRMPMTAPNKSPDEKSTQTESRRIITATQTEESYLTGLEETAKEEPTTIDSESEVEEAARVEEPHLWYTTSELANKVHRQDLLEVPTENKPLELEDEQ